MVPARLAVASVLASLTGLVGADAVANGGMEHGGGIPTGWDRLHLERQGAPLRAIRDTATAHEGEASLCLIAERPAEGNVGQRLEGVSGRRIAISGWVKGASEGAGIDRAGVVATARDADGKQVLWEEVVPVATVRSVAWQRFRREVEVPAEATDVLLLLSLRGQGRVWLDGVAVQEVGPAASSGAGPDAAPVPRGRDSPSVDQVATVAPDLLAIGILAQRVEKGRLERYAADPGDEVSDERVVTRGGVVIGTLIGPKLDAIVLAERITGDPLRTGHADRPGTWTISSAEDPAFAGGVVPLAVHRKSKPTDWCQTSKRMAMRHTVYLRLPRALIPGRRYVIACGDLDLREPLVTYLHAPDRTRSEAVHANHVGYRADDPVKRAFLSCWMGAHGGVAYDSPRFAVLDDRTGARVHEGVAELAKPADEPDRIGEAKNFSGAEVWRLDFSAITAPGRYRVVVDGVGSGHPFTIGDGVWAEVFALQMRGFANQRSGVPLAPPQATWQRPRALHPADGMIVRRSLTTRLDGGGLAVGDTGEEIADAWGGWHDAGDWNPRRVTHLQAALLLLELYELFPQRIAAVDHGVDRPHGLPTVLEEVVFGLDCFRRLQAADGGVGAGIETDADPKDREVSWNQSDVQYAWAPDCAASWFYAAVAARTARLVAGRAPALSATYRASALAAFAWAESDHAGRRAAGRKLPGWQDIDARNLASLELYRLTGERRWHDVFREDSCLTRPDQPLFRWGAHIQRDAAFAYTRLGAGLADPALLAAARKGLIADGDEALRYQAGNAFGIVARDPGQPAMLGLFSAPHIQELARAHVVSGQAMYLAGAVAGVHFAVGCNPSNMTYTTGLGPNPPRNVLHLDSRWTGQAVPPA